MNFDLSKLDTAAAADDGATLHILHPFTGERIGMSIVVAGTDSDRYRTARNAMLRKSMRRRTPADPEQLLADDAHLLAASTISWSGAVMDGKEVPFSEQAAFDLYQRFPWLREQVAEFMGDRANFFPKNLMN